MIVLLKACGVSLKYTSIDPYPYIDWEQRKLITYKITDQILPGTEKYKTEKQYHAIPIWLRRQDIETSSQ